MQKRIDYRVYPSLLDAFANLLNADADWEKYWGSAEDPPKTAQEYADECEVKLINTINRCPKEPIEAADKGTAFNEIVDCLIHDTPCTRPDMEITADTTAGTVTAKINGFTFPFSLALCREVAALFPEGTLSQYLCRSSIDTAFGCVELYGYIDEWYGSRIYDLKTTGQYDFGKFDGHAQRYLYPYCVITSGLATTVTEFEFTVVKLTKPTKRAPYIDGTCYREQYTYRHDDATQWLRLHTEGFIRWLERRRSFITDRRIFGGENPEGYVGTPITADDLHNHNNPSK